MGQFYAGEEDRIIGKPYNYSQMTYEEKAFPVNLDLLRQTLTERLGHPFNNCLLNYYEDGSNSMGWRSSR